MPATACPSRRFPGMPRAIPGPLRAKGTSPLETPDCRRRADHSASTRDRPAVSRPAGSRSSSVRWLPWVAITAPPLTCPVALRPVGLRFSGHARYVFRATEYLARPKPGCANRSEVAPAEPCNSLASCCTDPRYGSQSRPLPSSAPSRASSQAARMARSIPLAVNLMIRPVERLTA